MKKFVVVANRTGGQGKTLLSHLFASLFPPERVVLCADSETNGISKLGRMVSGVVELGAGPTSEDLREGGLNVYSYWDRLADSLLTEGESPVILDVGANIIDRILEWGAASDFKEYAGTLVDSILVVPVVAKPKSLSDAADLVRDARAQNGGIEFSRILVVRNSWQGGFEGIVDQAEYVRLTSMLGDKDVVADLPRCDSAILQFVEERQLYLAEVADLGVADIADLFGWPKMRAAREVKAFRSWYDNAAAVVDLIGLDHASDKHVDGRHLQDAVPKDDAVD